MIRRVLSIITRRASCVLTTGTWTRDSVPIKVSLDFGWADCIWKNVGIGNGDVSLYLFNTLDSGTMPYDR
jgi:hypothetical protein